MEVLVSNCSSREDAQLQLAVIDLQLFFVEIVLILLVLVVTIAKRLCSSTDDDTVSQTSNGPSAVETYK